MANRIHTKMSGFARTFWLSLGVGFVGSVLPDVDHPISLWLGIQDARFLHQAFTVLGVALMLCGIGTGIAWSRRLSKSRILVRTNGEIRRYEGRKSEDA